MSRGNTGGNGSGIGIHRTFDGIRQHGDVAGIQAVDPAVDGDFLAAFPGILKDGGARDMLRLVDDFEFAQPVQGGAGCLGIECLQLWIKR